ncbi:MAG TPA: hypothetical protein PKD09_18830 [Aggregatilinea sp.]|uniref:hypothetical protein n=1 Tax=Aggregatilinea sp. TaxID=2806333 RepID=UPI002B741480|nr:hypothetical protein [Aggregatilinea sp.]HML23719.1 hypothetical protein [Aggregatilinea sp.]
MSEPAPMCPSCGARLLPNPGGQGLWCQFCGVVRTDAGAQAQAVRQRAQIEASRPYEPPTSLRDAPFELGRMLNNAWDSIRTGDLRSAEYVLSQALSEFGDQADLWYLMSLTTTDRGERLIYLDRALETQAYHEYAWRDKGVLEGVIPAQDAGPLPETDGDEPVSAESQTEACPICGGALAYDVAAGALICGHCGYTPGGPLARVYHGGYDPLDNALLQRRFGFSREWKIGARVLVCQNCGAQLTLAGTTLSTQCRFCDSAHVLVRDAVGSFEEPDALLPFSVDRAEAARAVHARLSPDQRAQVVRGEVQGVYLPFWGFEGLASVSVPAEMRTDEWIAGGVYPAHDVLVCGATQPHQAVLDELMPFDLGDLRRYDPRALALWPAQIYGVDVIQASIAARAYVKYAARLQAQTDRTDYNPPDTPLWQTARVVIEGLSYRLVLLPVWMVTLYLSSGQHRPAAVNGQTGEAVVSATFGQPETILAGRRDRTGVRDLPIEPLRGRQNVIRRIAPR